MGKPFNGDGRRVWARRWGSFRLKAGLHAQASTGTRGGGGGLCCDLVSSGSHKPPRAERPERQAGGLRYPTAGAGHNEKMTVPPAPRRRRVVDGPHIIPGGAVLRPVVSGVLARKRGADCLRSRHSRTAEAANPPRGGRGGLVPRPNLMSTAFAKEVAYAGSFHRFVEAGWIVNVPPRRP